MFPHFISKSHETFPIPFYSVEKALLFITIQYFSSTILLVVSQFSISVNIFPPSIISPCYYSLFSHGFLLLSSQSLAIVFIPLANLQATDIAAQTHLGASSLMHVHTQMSGHIRTKSYAHEHKHKDCSSPRHKGLNRS